MGSLRALAAETVTEGELQSRWLVGVVSGLSTLAVLTVGYLFLTLYYAEGVLDAGAAEPVSSWLFPYFGSSATVEPSNGGLAFSMEPGPMPFIVAAAVFVIMARPWRSLQGRDRQVLTSRGTS